LQNKQKKFDMICPVAVESNKVRPLNSTLALGFYPWVSTEGRAKWLFLFLHSIPQGGIANGLHGLNPRNTAHGTPPCKRRPALVWRLVKQLVHGGNKASCISEQTRHAHLGLFDLII
jgi:hypothetical protein